MQLVKFCLIGNCSLHAALVHTCTHIQAKQRTVTGKTDWYDWRMNRNTAVWKDWKARRKNRRVIENGMLLTLSSAGH